MATREAKCDVTSADENNREPPAPFMSGAIQLESYEDSQSDVAREAVAPADGKLSKNQLKKLLRKRKWEEGREDRKVIRKERNRARKERRREERQKAVANGDENGQQNDSNGDVVPSSDRYKQPKQLPITFIYDCSWDYLMMEKEIISLGGQITRCYSDNAKAKFRSHLAISSYSGRLEERYATVLKRCNENWKGFRFRDKVFTDVATEAKTWMLPENKGGEFYGQFEGMDEQAARQDAEIVYLSSDSDETLTELKPFSVYIIGGLVDKNRHKGVCYKKARDLGMKTAKLPIGEYVQMASRKVLTVNHVSEIMLKWLEYGDWAKAFEEVIPKRKGGVSKGKGRQELNDGKATDQILADNGNDTE